METSARSPSASPLAFMVGPAGRVVATLHLAHEVNSVTWSERAAREHRVEQEAGLGDGERGGFFAEAYPQPDEEVMREQ